MPAKPKTDYPTMQLRIDQNLKDEFKEYCTLKGTTPSAALKEFMQSQVTVLWREKRKASKGVDTADFLN